MICAKVLFRCLERNVTYINSTSVGKYLKLVAFSHRSIKVKPFSTHTEMESLFEIPEHLVGMKKLDKAAFNKTIMVPCLIITSNGAGNILRSLKKYLLKVRNIKPVVDKKNGKIEILFNPEKINSWNDFDEHVQQKLASENITEANFSKVSVDITYDNWTSEALIKAVLPKGDHPLTSYSIIGHIIHLNIKEHLLEYRNVIGEILLQNNPSVKTVVYKKHFIDNVYRNFELEVICGEPNFITSVKENGVQFELDFSKVYWNPRLSTEHMRIVENLKERDVLFDVFAGIGPFAIPAARKKCKVFANDLNPEAIKWLEHNINLNKKAKSYIQVYNKDGKDFILEDIKKNLIEIWEDNNFNNCIQVVMNLPMIAATFLKYFNKLITKNDLVNLDVKKIKECLPIINCYFFVKDEEDKKTVFEEASGMKLDDSICSFQFVRYVSGSAGMFRITFQLPFEYLVEEVDNEVVEPLPKRICTE